MALEGPVTPQAVPSRQPQFFKEALRFVLQCPMLRVSKFTELHAPVIHVAL